MTFDTQLPFRFNGPAYVPNRDDARLTGQIRDIFGLMQDGEWRTLPDIASTTGHGEASVSAQLRHLRKPRFGGYTVDRRHVKNGLHEYRVSSEPTP
jgi:hypothetical protein